MSTEGMETYQVNFIEEGSEIADTDPKHIAGPITVIARSEAAAVALASANIHADILNARAAKLRVEVRPFGEG